MSTHGSKTGRNDPCPCGSGRKYKQCCLASTAAASTVATAPMQQAMDHLRAGRLAEAAGLYRQVLHDRPGDTEATRLLARVLYNQGVDEHAQGRLDEAATLYQQSIALDPRDGRVHRNLGALLQAQGRLDEAGDCHRRAIALDPADAGAHANIAVVFEAKDDIDAAIAHYRRSLALAPGEPRTHNNLGNALRSIERLDEAIACLQRAVDLMPAYVEAHSNLGNALADSGQLDAAIASFDRALALDPGNVDAAWNRGLACLMHGRLEEGWRGYEMRLRRSSPARADRGPPTGRPTDKPAYAGEGLQGKTLLVRAEQGLGDEVIHASTLPDVIRAAGHCIVECDPRLVPLYARSFPDAEVIPRGEPPHPRTQGDDIDWQCPVGSLPRFFRPTLASFAGPPAHLVPNGERVDAWRQRLAALGPSPKVGISWRSRNRSTSRNLHYTELAQWGQVLSIPGLTFINLQYDECRAELAQARQAFGVEVHAWDDLDQMNDIDGLAALMNSLDLVIGPTTSQTCLSAAVGAPTWMLITRNICWEPLGTGAIPMLPAVVPLWRDRGAGWDTVLDEVAARLRRDVVHGSTA